MDRFVLVSAVGVAIFAVAAAWLVMEADKADEELKIRRPPDEDSEDERKAQIEFEEWMRVR